MLTLIVTLLGDLCLGVAFFSTMIEGDTKLIRFLSFLILVVVAANLYCIKLAKEGAFDD